MKPIILAALLALPAFAFAEVSCSNSGEPPAKFDQAVTQKIIKWVSGVERHLDLRPPTTTDDAVKLQAAIAKWADSARSESVDSFFRDAVLHGVNAQYETLMAKEDQKNSKNHHFFSNLEAARSAACLSLTRYQ